MNKTKWILLFLLPVQWLSINLIKNQSLWIEQIYSQKVYPLLFKLQRFFFSALPFSFGDLAYGLAVVYIIWSLVQLFKRKLKARTLIVNTIAVASLLSLCFHLLWGLNYYRIPLNEKLNYKGEKKIKDGIHIMAPYIVTNVYCQLKFREFVYKNCEEILGKYNFANPYSDIFDRAVIDRNNWQMYGSTKPDQPPYLVKRVYNVYSDKVEEIENNKTTKDLIYLLSVRNKFDESLVKLEKQAEIEKGEKIKSNRTISKKKKKNAI